MCPTMAAPPTRRGQVMADPVPAPRHSTGARSARRSSVAAPSRTAWIVLWVAAVAGELGSLIPLAVAGANPFGEPVYLVFRLVGGSVTAFGVGRLDPRPGTRPARPR